MIQLFFIFLFGCYMNYPNQDEKEFAEKIKDLSEKKIHDTSDSSKLDLDINGLPSTDLKYLTDFEWDRICPSWAYEGSVEFKNRLQLIDLEINKDQNWLGDESVVRLVFIYKNKFVKVIRLHRSRVADFRPEDESSMNRCFKQMDTKISAEKTEAGAGLPSIFIRIF